MLGLKPYNQYSTQQLLRFIFYLGACLISFSLPFLGGKGVFTYIIPLATFLNFVFVIYAKTTKSKWAFISAANFLFMMQIFIFQIDFYQFIPLVYLIIFINSFLLPSPIVTVLFTIVFFVPIYQFKAGLPIEVLIGNIVGVMINTFIYTSLALLVRKYNADHEKMREKELKYRTLFDFSGDIIYLFELDHDLMPSTILEINDTACQKFGYKKEQLLLMNPLQFTAHDRLSKVKEVQLDLIKKGKLSFEGKYLSKNGEYIPSEITATVFNLKGKKVVLAIARDITERKQFEEKLQFLAYHDTLTGLPNRDFLKKRMKTLGTGTPIACLFVDLDEFKKINDTWGHDSGDILIKLAAQRLVECISDQGLVSRFGGDEFLIFYESASLEKANSIAEKVVKAFSKPFSLNDQSVFVTVSVGISTSFIGGCDLDEVVKKADLAMYIAKENGRNNYHLFEQCLKL